MRSIACDDGVTRDGQVFDNTGTAERVEQSMSDIPVFKVICKGQIGDRESLTVECAVESLFSGCINDFCIGFGCIAGYRTSCTACQRDTLHVNTVQKYYISFFILELT